MPVYQAQLDDGRLVSLESDHPPTEEEILGALDDYHAQRKAALTAERAKVRAEPPASVWGGKLKPDDDFSTPREIKEPPLTQVGLLDLVSQPLKEIVPKVGRETMERILNAPASLARERMEMTPDEEENSPLTKAMAQAIPSDKAVSIVTGTEHAAADLGNFFTSPLGIATLGIGLLPKLAQRAVALGFAAQMASGVPGIATELGSELGKPENERDYQKIAELTANGAAAVGFTAAGVTHGVGRPLAEKLGAYGGGPGLSGEATTAAPRPPRGPAAPPVDVTEELRKSLQESILGNQIKGKTPGVTVDVAPASGEVSPPESAEPAPPVTSFTTAKGSTYEVHEDGTTTRNKAARPEHPGEEGLQPRSSKTYYVSHTDSIYLGEIQTQGATVRRRIAQLPNGQIGIQYLDGKDAGKFESRTIADAEPGPAIGLTPVEVWDEPGGQAVHFGNEITEVRTDPRPKAEAKPAKLSQEDFVSDDPDWSIPDGALEAEHAERENELTLGPGRETTETASPGTSTVRTGTDDQGPNDERTGSAMTAESGVNPDRGEATPSLPKAPEPLPKGKKKFKAQRYDDDDNRGWDLIDEVESQLGGKISLAAARLLNSDFRPVGAARKLFGQSRWKPDIARQAVEANFPFDSDDEFLEALNATARGRIDARERWNRENRLLKQEEEQMETFNRDRKRQAGRKAQMLISDDLLEGDEFRMNGAKFRVERLGFDEHGHVTDVTLDDGKKYGTQRVREGTEILIDEGTLKRETNSEGGALREEAPLYGAPESVEEQKVRLAREAATRKKAADRDELERRRTSKLEGSRGDIGQRDLLGGGDLFSETAPAPEPGDPSLWNIPDKELLAEIDAVTERKVAGDLDRAGHERLRNLIHEYQERRPKIDRRKKTADPASDERPS